MDTSEVISLVEDLEDSIDDLEENLEPLLTAALSAPTKNLPVLDRAKLYVLVVYSIESLLFSYMRLNGVEAKEHAVYKELTRVKQYFEKIKAAEAGGAKPRENLNLNKQAASRIIKHALSGNDKFDAQRAERELKERLLAKRKLQDLETKMKKKARIDAGEATETPESNEEGEIHEEHHAPVISTSPDHKTSQATETKKQRKKRTALEQAKFHEKAEKKIRKKTKTAAKKITEDPAASIADGV